MRMKTNLRRLTALLWSLSLLLGLLAACSSETAATTMHLRRAQGKVNVSDDAGKDMETARNLALYSGYQVKTHSDSYAWIDLDEVKLAKLDESSRIEITKEGKRLEIEVKSGGLFFNVTEPLEDDETMEIRASTMVVGIRGTCGWVTLSEDKDTFQLWLLEGKVLCEAGDTEQTVQAGETAVMTRDGEITVSEFSKSDIPSFVQEELEDEDENEDEDDDPPPAGDDGDGSSGDSWPTVPGFAPQSGETPDVVEPWQEAYLNTLSEIRTTNQELPSTSLERADRYLLYDIDKDGTPELIAGLSNAYAGAGMVWVYTFRDGAAVNVLCNGQQAQYLMNSPAFVSHPGENGVILTHSGGPHGSMIYQIWLIEDEQLTVQSLSSDTYTPDGTGLYWSDISSDEPVLQYR